jgi:cytochrome d ubiquinol oxidase subunit II
MLAGTPLQNVWYLLIGVLLCGYSLLDGFDLGLGVLMPVLGKSADDRDSLFRSIAPFWDGNEVWLLTAGGALFAAFPHAYATVFSGFYLALMLVLFALILRAVSIEFRVHAQAGKRLWEAGFVAGSAVPALLFGVALGNVMMGVPLDPNMEYAGSFFTLLRPLPLVFGLLGLTAFALRGSAWAALKTTGSLQERAGRGAQTAAAATGAAFLLSFLAVIVYIPGAVDRVPAWIFSAALVASLGFVGPAIRKKRYGRAFRLTSAVWICLWGVVGSVHYPFLVRASDIDGSLTLANASSSPLTLKVMLIIAAVGMPVVIAYTIFVYRIFRGRGPAGEAGNAGY